MYGGGAFTLYNTLSDQDAVDENGDPVTKEKAQEYYDRYFEAYAGVAEFIRNQKKFAHRHEKVFCVRSFRLSVAQVLRPDYQPRIYRRQSCRRVQGQDHQTKPDVADRLHLSQGDWMGLVLPVHRAGRLFTLHRGLEALHQYGG